ncbi:hypothetical protein [Flavobacterium psychrophilum]|uniref:hypothetical protein n=1 Tax=Flavobacterium psychrophilum TaxID=96345 RepID=UPI0009BECC34|nr:hypothetical protein [Flavobacterium psychrophilum]ELI6455516.1 hypothetical protein [Flavobacterium psychrophilum]OUD27101.1 hypothetical protein FPG92_10860 [Flavobacterium psychrophilum]
MGKYKNVNFCILKFTIQYKEFLSHFKSWDQIKHAKEWLLFPKNIAKRLSIDQTSLSNGELYTILTHKSAKGKAGTIVAMVSRTKADAVIESLKKSLSNNET